MKYFILSLICKIFGHGDKYTPKGCAWFHCKRCEAEL